MGKKDELVEKAQRQREEAEAAAKKAPSESIHIEKLKNCELPVRY